MFPKTDVCLAHRQLFGEEGDLSLAKGYCVIFAAFVSSSISQPRKKVAKLPLIFGIVGVL